MDGLNVELILRKSEWFDERQYRVGKQELGLPFIRRLELAKKDFDDSVMTHLK